MNDKHRIYTLLPYYIVIGFVAMVLKYTVRFADNDSLWFMLKPVNGLIELLTSSESIYSKNRGYVYEGLNIAIDHSCAGLNLWVIAFVMFAYLSVKHRTGIVRRTFGIALSLIVSLLFTILANTSRIFAAITIQPFLLNTLPFPKSILHEAIGVCVNLSFLILAYILINNILTYKNESL